MSVVLRMSYWKRRLMEKLNAGKFDTWEWLAFIKRAKEEGFDAMAADMQNRLDHYKNQTQEQK